MADHEKINAPTIDELIAKLKEISEKGYGNSTWYGWDDTSLIIEPENMRWIMIYPDP